ncbi:TetR/AcrR family transcriptional regulator [Amycolatopsis regifaucium]|uniref:TetR family transcriptional regulator n=1 Tax=Amycolatopsis regifaucium TaxID=546365 RepID=A0A154MHM9_9PSEU|nr:TetR/AcrR family transcriptional regulator [Amycolatopsis regifaucium]KZB83984.1 TetR family transcriptional regulator [Amycolatopsis regifaucium]OKA06978.1 TetR family transcriptional regulator [Amycolatopsis regifaucium]
MPRAERERQMIEIAEEVFSERGYTAASMDEIAERVGVSKPMLYEYFNSKEGLLLACIQQSRAALREVTERATVGATTAEEALRRGLLAFFVFIRERRQAWSLLRHEMALIGTPAADEIEQTRRQQTDLIAALMSDYIESDDDFRAEASAEFVVGACERLAIWCERHEDVSPEMATGYAMDILWAGLSARTR